MTGRSETPKGASSRPPISEATRTKMRLAKIGKAHSEEHKRRIGEGVRQWSKTADPWQKRRSWRRYLSDEEAADLDVLRRAGLNKGEALRAINRGDLAKLVLASIGRENLLTEPEARVSAPDGGRSHDGA